jgi:hypothetical protein
MKKNSSYATLIVAIILLNLIISSCDFEPKEYISVYVVNHTGETILIYAGANILFIGLPSASISSGNGQAVMVEKGGSISAYGKDSNRKYGSRSFFMETQWDIY